MKQDKYSFSSSTVATCRQTDYARRRV